MDYQKKCSQKKHNDIDALFYCQECNIYMCNKCSIHHSELFENHNKFEMGKEIINTSLCKEENHKSELKFYCKNHNKLCCGICITKIKGDGYGQHTDCQIYLIEKIVDEKLNNLKSNIKYLEDISLNIDNSMKELKNIAIKIEENKEELKIKVSKIFTKLRNAINEREDKLLMEIENKFNEFILEEKVMKQNEKMPNKIKELLYKGKKIENEFKNKDIKLSIFINDCIEIEKTIQNFKIIQQNIENCKSKKIKVNILPKDEKEINKIINNINTFGQIIKEENEIFYINNLNSLIIKNDIKFNNLLKSWINNDNQIEAELLYRLTKDGEKVSKFHELCDNKGPTLTLFITTDENIGGIYTLTSWDKVSREKFDKDAFMFNLNKEEKYINIGKESNIWCTDYFGPWTWAFGFNRTMKKIEHRGIYIDEKYQKGSQILPNNSKNYKNFDVLEVEVYKIQLKNNN